MARLDIALLGGFGARLDGQPVEGFVSTKARALLAYLATEADRPHQREELAALLWPECSTPKARRSLSQALFNLRSILGDRDLPGTPGHTRASSDESSAGLPVCSIPFLLVRSETIQCNPASDQHADVTLFTSLLQASAEHAHHAGEECEACLRRLAEAVDLYRGDLMQDLAIGDSVPFEEWAAVRREQLHRQALDALQRLAAAHGRRGDYARGLSYAWRQVELDPWREEGQRHLMHLLALAGQRGAALAQYETCRKALAEELGAEPAAETTALYDQIREGSLFVVRPLGRSWREDGPDGRTTNEDRRAPAREDRPDDGQQSWPLAANEDWRIFQSPRPLFVARGQELARLERWLDEALRGQGRVGLVVGEPGSGKTMLLAEFARRAMETYPDLIVARGICNAYTGAGDPYLPFREILALLSGDVEEQRAVGEMSLDQMRRLIDLVPATVGALLERGPDLLNLLVSGEGLLARLAQGSPSRPRLETVLQKGSAPGGLASAALLEQAAEVLLSLARQYPLLVVLDDLQWADTGSINLLFHLARKLAGHRLLVLGAYRPEEVALGREGGRHPLEPVLAELRRLWGENTVDLALAEGRKLVDALVDSEPNRLGREFRQTLYRHTGGHALFTAELLESLRDGGGLERDQHGRWVEGAALDWGRLPARVEAVIEERMGRLSAEEQELLSVASVEGEEFHAEVVARVLGLEEGATIRLLSGPLTTRHRLVGATALEKVGADNQTILSRYRFRHYLFRQYLYERLDAAQRGRLHGQVGLALEAPYGPYPGTESLGELFDWLMDPGEALISLTTPSWSVVSQLARHFEAAGMTVKALAHLCNTIWLSYWVESFDQAMAYMDRFEAIVATLPHSLDKISLEYWAASGRAYAWQHSMSWIAPQAYEAILRACGLAERLGRPALLTSALSLLGNYYVMRGELNTAREHDQRARDILREYDPAATDEPQEMLLVLLLGGELERARKQLAPLYAPLLESPPRLQGFRLLDDCASLGHAPWALWALGYPDRALAVGQGTLAMAHASEVPFYIAQALFDGVCFPGQLRREVERTAVAVAELAPLAQQMARPYIMAYTTLYQGWVQAQCGDLAQGIETLRRGLDQWAQNHLVMLPYWKGFLAEALGRAGRVDEGLALLEEAREQAERGGEGWSLPEVYRRKGELLVQKAGPSEPSSPALLPWGAWEKGEEAEACFRRAIAVAQGQQAKSWELRATTNLARLLRAQGRAAEGRAALAAIYGWFTEGFDTPDLIEARSLLHDLALR